MAGAEVNTAKKARVFVTVSKDSMNATVMLRKPGEGDPPITIEEVTEAVADQGIVFGLDQEAIQKVVAEEIYNSPAKIASGTPPTRGANSQFEYHFDTTDNHHPQVDEDGRIDYKNINFVQNVEKGKILVTKIPARPGQPGTDIYGKVIKGPDGRDLPFKAGANTEPSEDGLSLVATASGAIVFLYEKVSVNDVMLIKGDVDFNVGNIDCLGSVRVTGDIKAGFELKVDGDLEVSGNVEDSTMDVKGNVMIKGGFFGKGTGILKAGGDIFIKFCEGQKIVAGGNIYVGGEVIGCNVRTKGNVWVKGRKGKIVGGEIRANKEIRAGVLGSEAYTKTLLAVAYDHELMKKYYTSIKEINRLKEDGERIKGVLYQLYRLQLDGKLSGEQAEALAKLEKFQKELPDGIAQVEKTKAEVEEQLHKLEGARIVAEEIMYPGVRATFGLIYREINEEATRCVAQLEANKVVISDFKE
ncbi:MAG TPA: FapA family protein [candidate division Zixibacteria bacterium]|nr:FapA family protein [candidate division Zixibacteria bacterium]